MYFLFYLMLVVVASALGGYYIFENEICGVFSAYLFHLFVSYVYTYSFHELDIEHKIESEHDKEDLRYFQSRERSGLVYIVTNLITSVICSKMFFNLELIPSFGIVLFINLIACFAISIGVNWLLTKICFFRYNLIEKLEYKSIYDLKESVYFRYSIRKIHSNITFFLILLCFL